MKPAFPASLLLYAKITSAEQMFVYDASSTNGAYQFKCPPDGGWCLVRGSFQTKTFGPTAPVEEAIQSDRYNVYGYQAYELISGDAFLETEKCRVGQGNCDVTCDEQCECRTGENFDQLNETCVVNDIFPDTSITSDSEFTLFTAPVHGEDETVEFRCEGGFQLCQQDFDAEGSYEVQIGVSAPGFFYAMDFQKCQQQANGIDSSKCLVGCDPRCTCSQMIGDERVECGTIPNTDSPTMAPAPAMPTGNDGSDANKRPVDIALVFSIVYFTIATYTWCL